MDGDTLVGVVVSKLEVHRGGPLRGYIAMLAVKEQYRGGGIGIRATRHAFGNATNPNEATQLVQMAIDAMIARDADEVASFLSR